MVINSNLRTLIAVIIATLAVLSLYALVPFHPDKPSGVFLPAGRELAPTFPDQISVFNRMNAPLVYQRLGYINVQYHPSGTSTQAQEQLLHRIKVLAAKAGANGVIITLYIMPDQVNEPSALQRYVVSGLAVYYVPNL